MAVDVKICNKCKHELSADKFGKEKRNKDGLRATCKECRSRLEKEYYERTKDKHAARVKKYKDANREEVRRRGRKYYADHKKEAQAYRDSHKGQIAETNRRYREKQDKEEVAAYQRKYRKKNKKELNRKRVGRRRRDTGLRILHSLRTRMNKVLKGASKSDSTMKLVGCTIKELRRYLESMFREGMSWKNYGRWHIDHVVPCASFDLSSPEEQRKCFHYTNLQPLWAEENWRKCAKVNYGRQ